MKRSIVLLTVIMVMAVALGAMAASPVVKVRVVDVSVFGEDELTDDAGIARVATISAAENPQLFPALGSLVFSVGKDNVAYAPDAFVPAGSLKFSGSIGDKEPFEFISIPYSDRVGKFDLAIVGRDGKVTYIDEQVVIDYNVRTISAASPVTVKDGDTLLIFVREATLISYEKRETQLDRYQTEQPRTPLTNQNETGGSGGHGGRGGTGGGKG